MVTISNAFNPWMIQILLDDTPLEAIVILSEDLKGREKKLADAIIGCKRKAIPIDAVSVFLESHDQSVLCCYVDYIQEIDRKKYFHL